jgi:hypothetical protein
MPRHATDNKRSIRPPQDTTQKLVRISAGLAAELQHVRDMLHAQGAPRARYLSAA